MDSTALMPLSLALSEYVVATPQQSGALTMLPLLKDDAEGDYTPPLSGMKLSRVQGYGNVELANPSGGNGDSGIAIVPLHIGYIQDGAQNHALCHSAFVAQGQKLMFQDACCIQESQGGYLQEASQWFFVLPLLLREKALYLRGVDDFEKLWEDISKLNQLYHLPQRGHLEQLVCRQRPYLTQFASRFEILPGQRGALFFLNEKLVGLEIAPTAQYFQEIWHALVCFCYGPPAMYLEQGANGHDQSPAFEATSLHELRSELDASRSALSERLHNALAKTQEESFNVSEEDNFLDLSLNTVTGKSFSGQIVRHRDSLVYASMFGNREYVRKALVN